MTDLGSGPVIEAHKVLGAQPQQGAPIDLLNGKAGLDLLKLLEVLVQPAASHACASAGVREASAPSEQSMDVLRCWATSMQAGIGAISAKGLHNAD